MEYPIRCSMSSMLLILCCMLLSMRTAENDTFARLNSIFKGMENHQRITDSNAIYTLYCYKTLNDSVTIALADNRYQEYSYRYLWVFINDKASDAQVCLYVNRDTSITNPGYIYHTYTTTDTVNFTLKKTIEWPAKRFLNKKTGTFKKGYNMDNSKVFTDSTLIGVHVNETGKIDFKY